jgi:hypothetical protein
MTKYVTAAKNKEKWSKELQINFNHVNFVHAVKST